MLSSFFQMVLFKRRIVIIRECCLVFYDIIKSIFHTGDPNIEQTVSQQERRILGLITGRLPSILSWRDARDNNGRNLVMWAVEQEEVEKVKWLLKQGVNPNVIDHKGMTPLLYAAKGRKANDLIPLLIEYGADVTARTAAGNSLHFLTRDNPVELPKVAKALIENGANLHDRTDYEKHYQPLHLAIKHHRNEMLKLFIEYGGDINAVSMNPTQLPIHLAAGFNNIIGTATLIKCGADLTSRTIYGHNALHLACINEDEELIKLLLSAGVDVLAEDENGKTPFSLLNLLTVPQGVNLIIKALALAKISRQLFQVNDERIIREYPLLWNFYQDCVICAFRMQLTPIIPGCTFLDLLTKKSWYISLQFINRNFESNFCLYNLTAFNMYGPDLHDAFERGRYQYQMAIVGYGNLINEAFYYELPDLVIRIITRFLNIMY